MKTELVTYEDQGKILGGFLAYDEKKSNQPGVILCHAWKGRDEFVCEKAKEIADWGYAAFALDVYGKGILGHSREENQALMKPFMENRQMLLKRLLAGLEAFKKQPAVDKSRIAVMGFCFGGLCALDMARSGADLKGAISVHGLLSASEQLKKQQIKAKILALHGYEDPLVPMEQVTKFGIEMEQAKADWQIHIYGGTKHAFTVPTENDPGFGTVYNPVAEKRAWQSIKNFLKECL